jgi:hypothetical protein
MSSLPPLPPSPLMIGLPMNSGIDIYSDKIEYKTIQAATIEYLDKYVNEHIKNNWKLHGNMSPVYKGKETYSRIEYNQTLIRKLPAKGGRRHSSIRTRKTKLKSRPPYKS